MIGKFIVIEGLDFTGKTTQSYLALNLLIKNGISSIVTREPGGTKLGESIRDIVLSGAEEEVAKEAILLLFMASRAENIAKIVHPALKSGKTVICDRFIASTLVYQGVLSGFESEDILKAHCAFNYGLFPDLTILLDADPETLIKRRDENSARHNNKYDFLPPETIKKLREKFLETALIPSLNTKIVKSDNTQEETFMEVSELVMNLCRK